jgi:hypothetical protein
VIVTGVEAVTAIVVTGNVADSEPIGTETLAGTVAAAVLLLDRVTVMALPCALDSVTVPVLPADPATVDGETPTE